MSSQCYQLPPHMCMIVIVTLLISVTFSLDITVPSTSDVYLDALLDKYGSNRSLSTEQLSSLLESAGQSPRANPYPTCNWTDVKWTTLPECAMAQCLSAVDLFALQHHNATETLSKSELFSLSPLLVYELQKKNCRSVPQNETIRHIQPLSTAELWGYGFLCVTIVNALTLTGAAFAPVMKTNFYKHTLTWMVGLAVGTLTATAVIILIPKAWGLIGTDLTEDPAPRVMRSLIVLSGLYMFFLLERVLKFGMDIKKKRRRKKSHQKEDQVVENDLPFSSISGPRHTQSTDDISHLRTASSLVNESMFRKEVYTQEMTIAVNNISVSDSIPEKTPEETLEKHSNDDAKALAVQEDVRDDHGHSHGDGDIASVAWMIIVGDGLHNFVDGLSIGAAFTDSLMSGISVSVAVACEELPHELGDFAILISSGMSIKQAMIYNMLSACTCYLGLITGIMLGENTDSTDWIFAIAGGMFLYIALVDMTPEMNITAEEVEKQKETVCDIQVFFLQHFGILLGVAIIAVMALYDRNIDFTSSTIMDDTVTAAV